MPKDLSFPAPSLRFDSSSMQSRPGFSTSSATSTLAIVRFPREGSKMTLGGVLERVLASKMTLGEGSQSGQCLNALAF
jgi:hypothetical protein